MFKDAAPNLKLFPDYDSKLLRVQKNVLEGPAYLAPMWKEVAAFPTKETWRTSEYASKVTDEEWLDDLAWFWHDLENPLPPQPQASA